MESVESITIPEISRRPVEVKVEVSLPKPEKAERCESCVAESKPEKVKKIAVKKTSAWMTGTQPIAKKSLC